MVLSHSILIEWDTQLIFVSQPPAEFKLTALQSGTLHEELGEGVAEVGLEL